MDDEKKFVQKIITKQKNLANIRMRWEETWEEITAFLLPYFELYIQKNPAQRGQKVGSRIYNGIPINAAQSFANGFQGYLVSPNMTWFRTQMEREELNDLPEVREWLQDLDKIFYHAFQKTNFYSSMNELFRTGGTICTSTLYVEEDLQERKILFNPRHPYEIFIDVNRYNQVDTVYRRIKLTARIAAQEFGKENLHHNIQKSLEYHNDDNEFEFIHAVEPREERKEWKLDAKNKKYASCYIDATHSVLVKESGYNRIPYVVWRPEKDIHQTYGGGPGVNALTDIMTLNLVSKDLLHAAHLAVNPAMQTAATMRGKVRVIPGGISYFTNADEMINPVHVPAQFPVGLDREEKIEMVIRKHYFLDFFLMLAEAERQMTATEIVERQGEKAAMLGPMIGNLNDDVLNPIFDIVFEKLIESGEIPPPPPSLQKYEGENILKLDFLGPLAQAQKRLFQSHGVTRGLEAVQGVLTFRPEVADILDWDEVTRQLLESFGMPQKAMLPEEQVTQIRQARAQMMQQQQALEAAGQMADAAGKINKKTESGSLLEEVQKQTEGATEG